MKLPFTKMHGLGNDFVVLDGRDHPLELDQATVRRIADRRLGVGCDQVLVLESPRQEGAAAWYRVFNHDGGEVEQCGNGVRCLARWLADRGQAGSTFELGSRAGPMSVTLADDGAVSVSMGVPRFAPEDVPFLADEVADDYELDVDGRTIRIGVVSMGNPHAVLRVDDVHTAPVGSMGESIEGHRRFPSRANVGFMQVVARDRIRLRVFERGTGETLACGSGACAAVAVGRRQGLLDERVDVELPGGHLEVHWPGGDETLIMKGPATRVFEGTLDL